MTHRKQNNQSLCLLSLSKIQLEKISALAYLNSLPNVSILKQLNVLENIAWLTAFTWKLWIPPYIWLPCLKWALNWASHSPLPLCWWTHLLWENRNLCRRIPSSHSQIYVPVCTCITQLQWRKCSTPIKSHSLFSLYSFTCTPSHLEWSLSATLINQSINQSLSPTPSLF